MNVTEILQFTDELVFSQTGKHLDTAQEAIVKGVWEGKTYEEIANESNRSERHIRDIGYKLWKILSEQLGENVQKSNFHCTFERLKNSRYSSQQVVNIGINSNITLNPNGSQFESHVIGKAHYQPYSSSSSSTYCDLTLAPQIFDFYNRKTELATLFDWIINQNARLISVLGLSGIGKTTLVKKFVDLNLENFEVIIWKNLKFPKSLESLLDEILTTCQQEPQDNINDKLKQVSTLLVEQKSLIILDDVQNLFISGEFVGQYQIPYFNYQNWFKTLTESQHQSSIILISQEQSPEMYCLDEELYPIKCIELSGLDNSEILENKNLKDPDRWSELISLYQGNQKCLQDITILIKDFFDGSISDFLAEDQPILTNQMRSQFQQLFSRLSNIEQQVVFELSQFSEPVTRETLKEKLTLSSTDFINALESLHKRYLITKIKTDKTQFDLFPVFKAYLKTLS